MSNRDRDAEILRQRLADSAAVRGTASESVATAGAESPAAEADTPAESVTTPGDTGETNTPGAAPEETTPQPTPETPVIMAVPAGAIFAALPAANGTLSVKVFADKAAAAAQMDIAAFKTNGGRFFSVKEIVPKVKVTL